MADRCFGHMYGEVAAAICREEQYFALPLDLNIQDGLAETSQWAQGNPARSDSHVVQMTFFIQYIDDILPKN